MQQYIFQTDTIQILESEYLPIPSTNADTSTAQKMEWIWRQILFFCVCLLQIIMVNKIFFKYIY